MPSSPQFLHPGQPCYRPGRRLTPQSPADQEADGGEVADAYRLGAQAPNGLPPAAVAGSSYQRSFAIESLSGLSIPE
jgi:hypothetical protein